MGTIASQITSLTIVYSSVYSGADQRKHQSSVSLAFVWGIHRGPVNSPHKWPVTRKMFPFDDVIMAGLIWLVCIPTASINNHFIVTSQAYSSIPQQPKHQLLAQIKYDALVMSAIYWEYDALWCLGGYFNIQSHITSNGIIIIRSYVLMTILSL